MPNEIFAPVRAKVGEKGRLVIPADFRKALGLKAGDPVILEIVDDQITISTFEGRLKRTQERMRKYAIPGVSAVDELIAERRTEVKKEEDEYEAWKQARGASGTAKS
jgi:AbrB family looped-hinge helix DNA binding protein